MKKVPYVRRILLVNRSVQMRLVLYGVFTGIVCGFFTASLLTGLQRGMTEGGPGALAIFLAMGVGVLALVIVLGLVISSQIAGPIHRLHRNLRKIRDGEPPEKIHIRKGDAYGDLFEDYNRVVDRLTGHGK